MGNYGYLGRDIKLPFDRNLEKLGENFESRIEFQSELIKKLAIWYEKAIANINKSQDSQKKYYDKRHKNISFSVGQLVLKRTHELSDKSKGTTRKFFAKWCGLFKKVKVLSPVPYVLSNLDDELDTFTCNVVDLKLYFDRPSLDDGVSCNNDNDF